MSILHHKRERVPGVGERVYRRRVCVSRAYISGSYGKHPADCHILWSAIILVLGMLLPFCRECGVSPDSRFFVYKTFERKREK